MSQTFDPPLQRHSGSRRGVWTIVAIFAFGIAVLIGLILSPRSQSPRVPEGLVNGLPQEPVRGVLLDCGPFGASPDAVIAAIQALQSQPDLLLLVDIESSVLPPIVEKFGLYGFYASYHAELFQQAQPNPASGERIGICVLSRHGLYESAPVRVGRRSIGVETVMAVGGRAMHVRCVAVDDFGELPAPILAPKSLAGGPPPVLLTGGRVRGAWSLAVAGAEGGFRETRREEGPVGVAFTVGLAGAPGAMTSRAPAAGSAAVTSRPAPATDRAEPR